ncbi:MAG: helix-turn-helix domain-containing protein, partial [Bacteroidota bacterium]
FLSHMSVSTFKRAFQQHYQDTPIRWFQRQRLAHAALRLRAGTHRPIDVFEEAGYQTFSNFVHAFKKAYGITPKRYQQES